MTTKPKALQKQTISRIDDMFAVDGMVCIKVYEHQQLQAEGSRPSVTQVWSVREAATRALAMNRQLKKLERLSNFDKKQFTDMIERLTVVCKEALLQQSNPDVCKRAYMRKNILSPQETVDLLKNSNFGKGMEDLRRYKIEEAFKRKS